MEELSALIERSQTGDKEARETLIESNLGLVHHIIRRFAGRGHEMEDLFQIGVIGLMKAIDKFDLRIGVKFSTYAVPLITGEIKRFLRDDGLVKVSRTVKENGLKVRMARQRLQGKLNREPSIQEIGAETGLAREEIVLAMEAGLEVESIYSAACQEDGSEVYLVDRVVQGASGSVGKNLGNYDNAGNDEEKERLLNRLVLQQLLDSLGARERQLIDMRYFQNMTQTQAAGILGISQVQVSRLEKRILLQLREKV